MEPVALEPIARLYVDAVLKARDALLDAGIGVIAYDLYPNGVGSLVIMRRDHDDAVRIAAASGIQVSDKPKFVTDPQAPTSAPRNRD